MRSCCPVTDYVLRPTFISVQFSPIFWCYKIRILNKQYGFCFYFYFFCKSYLFAICISRGLSDAFDVRIRWLHLKLTFVRTPPIRREPYKDIFIYFLGVTIKSCALFSRRAMTIRTSRYPLLWCTSGAWWMVSWKLIWWRLCRNLESSGKKTNLYFCLQWSLCLL